MKRLINLLLALVLVLAMSPAVYADVVYIPDDDFLDAHVSDREDRSYTARTEVKVYEDPGTGKVVATLSEGDSVHVYYIWTDALLHKWGCIETEQFSGWIPMAYMKRSYDSISFREDYSDQFRSLGDWVYLDEAYAGQEIRIWSYPCSESSFTWTFDSDPESLPCYGTLYTDDSGLDWCYVNYSWGFTDFWICLSDPTADFETLYPNGAPQVVPEEELPPLPRFEIRPGFTAARVMTGIGVVLCVLFTVAVLREKKKETEKK